MSEPRRIQVIRPNQDLQEYAYVRSPRTGEMIPLDGARQIDYYAVGLKRLNAVQAMPLKENWPIILGNAAMSFMSGLLGGAITRRIGTNLSLNLTSSVVANSGACFLVVTVTHLLGYYYSVLRPLYSGDPLLCPTCLEIRSFALASATPILMGTPIAVLSNLSSAILNKSIRLPPTKFNAYPAWYELFRRHAFKNMSTRFFFAYPLFNGLWASLIFFGQSYYWNHTLKAKLIYSENQYSAKEKAA